MSSDISQSAAWTDFDYHARDDFASSFARIRGQLVDRRNVRLTDFVAELTPKYWRVYLDIAIGYAAMAGSLVLTGLGQAAGLPFPLLVAGGAVLVGFWFFYLVSFLHEGAHWNLARDRRVSDRLCDLLLSWMIGVRIKTYRRHHFEHHRSLGTVHDTEISYFFPLSVKTLLKSLLGIRAIEAMCFYLKGAKERAGLRDDEIEPGRSLAAPPASQALLTGVAVHALIVGGLWLAGWSAAALAWIVGVGAVMPVLNAVRQVLEHRSMDARVEIDYSKVDQGACARIFGTGLFASTFGAAGANRHLLHHWEPQVSYTRLPDLERFLDGTAMRVVMDRRRTSYFRALRTLFGV